MKSRATIFLAVVFLTSSSCRPADKEIVKSDSAVTSSTSSLIVAPKRVDSLTFELPLQNGKFLTFRDNPAEGDNYVHYEYVGPVPGIGYHLIRRQYYESVQYLLIHPRTGITSVVPDSPVVSPDQSRVLVASMNFEDRESPNSLEVWQTTNDSLRLEFQVETGDANAMTGWGASNAHWVNATTAGFTRNYPIKNTTQVRQSPGWLVLHATGWGIQDQRP
jgi:hypothetical protein